jgi:hypothetical protein
VAFSQRAETVSTDKRGDGGLMCGVVDSFGSIEPGIEAACWAEETKPVTTF